jgi:methionyl-tRNA formyltransferase
MSRRFRDMRIVFFGTPQFAANVLSFLLKNHLNIVAVVTKPDKPQGRSKKTLPSAVKEFIQSTGLSIPIHQPEKASSDEFARKLKAYHADLFVVVAYGEIIKQNLLNLPSLSCINLHASLLPKYRGASPIQFALLAGEKKTGITIIEMSLEMDAGDILAQEKVLIPDDMVFSELEAKLCEVGSQKLLEVIKAFEAGTVEKTPQDHARATYVQKIDPSLTRLDWRKEAEKLHHLIHAFSLHPGAWCLVEIGKSIKRLKILKSRLNKEVAGSAGHTLVRNRKSWVVACGEGALELVEVQLEGKKRMSASEFLRGVEEEIVFKI